jgi:hypothetical protein
MSQTLLEIERQKVSDAQRDALAAQSLWHFYSKHREVLDNQANTNLLKEACGPDDLTLSALEFVYANSEKLQRQLSRHSDDELAQFTIDEQQAAYKKLRGMTKEELYVDGKRKQQEELDAATRKAIPPADLTRRSFADATRSERAKWVERYGFAALNAHFDRQEGR